MDFTLIGKLIIWRVREFFNNLKPKKVLIKEPRNDCYLDEATVLNNEFISLSNKLIYIDYTLKQKFDYNSIYELLQDHPHYDGIFDKAFVKTITEHIVKKYPNSLVLLERTSNSEFTYRCHIMSFSSFIKIFTDPSIRHNIEETLSNSVGIRYTGSTKLYSESLQHYIGTSLIYNDKFLEHGKQLEFYSNFEIVLQMLNKSKDSIFDLHLVNDNFIQLVNDNLNMSLEDCENIYQLIVGDKDIEEFVLFNEILK